MRLKSYTINYPSSWSLQQIDNALNEICIDKDKAPKFSELLEIFAIQNFMDELHITYNNAVHLLNKLVKLGVYTKFKSLDCDEICYSYNDEFDWSKYNSMLYETTRYLVSGYLSNIEWPEDKKFNAIVEWNGIELDELCLKTKEQLSEEFKSYTIFISNLSEIKLKEKSDDQISKGIQEFER